MKIKQLCKCAKDDENTLYLLDEYDEEGEITRQYVNLSGRAMFPLDGMPRLNEETLLYVMDIPKEQHVAWSVVRGTINAEMKDMIADARATDGEEKLGRVGIAMNGYELRIVVSEGGDRISFVEGELLKVVSDYKGLDIWQRYVGKHRVFVLMNGMKAVGCVTPTNAHWGQDEALELCMAGRVGGRVYNDWEQMHEAERN